MKHINNHYGQSQIFGRPKINLQLFADDPTDPLTDPPKDPEPPKDPKPKNDPPVNPDKQFTQKDIDDAVEAARKEAAKLAKMNAQQKQEYEYEKLQKENEAKDARIAELEKEAMRSTLSKQAAEIMKNDHDIIATQDMLDFVVGDDAEQTKALIDKLVGIILEDRKQVETARATGRTPRTYSNNGNTMSEIDKRIAKYQ